MNVLPEDAQPAQELLQGAQAWQAALRELLAKPGATITMYSPDYADWPLGSAEVVAGLDRWAAGRQRPCVRMLARTFKGVQRDFPRFVQWRGRFAHLIACHVLPDEVAAPQECLLTADAGLLAIPGDKLRFATRCFGSRLRLSNHAFDQVWDLSAPDFPVQTLGL